MQEVSILTYNILFNKALPQLKKVVEKYHPDIICLQEVETQEASLKKLEWFDYKLADYSNSFFKFGKIYGIATYFNSAKLHLIYSDALNLPRNIWEIILMMLRTLRGGNKPRTSLRTDFKVNGSNTTLTIYNMHLTALATNHSRKKQLNKVLSDNIDRKKTPTIISGDLNYLPYQRKELERLIKEHGFREATKKIFYTFLYPRNNREAKYNLFQILLARIAGRFYDYRMKYDYIFYRGLSLVKTKRIEIVYSDHYPIISYFKLR